MYHLFYGKIRKPHSVTPKCFYPETMAFLSLEYLPDKKVNFKKIVETIDPNRIRIFKIGEEYDDIA